MRCRDDSLSYEELDSLSGRAASLLRAYGVGRGDRVGIYLDKSIASVISLFAILKAGAAYVPVDPLAPRKRVEFILSNCEVAALVTSPARFSSLDLGLVPSLRCILMADGTDADSVKNGAEGGTIPVVPWSAMDGFAALAGDTGNDPEDLAYILYTSGSTGTPKGVAISHRAALAFVNWAAEEFDVRSSDILSNHAPFHFDLSVFDIFAGVKAGATVVPVPPEVSVFPLELASFIERERITVWYSVPSALTRLVLNGRLANHDLRALRTILFAGEVFPPRYLRELMAVHPAAEYFNLYGPTETNVSTFYRVTAVPKESDPPLPIGKPCAGDQVLIRSDRGSLVADEAGEGELLVTGPTLMTGYWGLPDRTRESLWTDETSGTTYYRTGDLVRWDSDGNLTFLGRRDDMIKCRGYRVELGEIESVLYRHPGVETAAAVPVEAGPAEVTIKAVLVPKPGISLSELEVRDFVARYLPRYMVPDSVEFRESVPMTSSGKIDKKLLR